MPLYEYQCGGCSQITEIVQKFSDPPLEKCPHCNGPLTKLLSKTSFQLKGSGWYNTDYKKPKAPKSEAATSTVNTKPTESTAPTTPSEKKPSS